MKRWQVFASYQDSLKKLLNYYLQLREEFQRWGYTEKQLEKIQSAPPKIWQLRGLIGVYVTKLKQIISDFGFDVNDDEFNEYIQKKFKEINDITPLNDGDNTGNNRRDEDN